MPKIISGTPQVVANQLLRVDPDRNIQVELTLKRVSGAEGVTARLAFIDACKAAEIWKETRDASSEAGGVTALLEGRAGDMVQPIRTLEGRERVLS
jgi:hypothetical protein